MDRRWVDLDAQWRSDTVEPGVLVFDVPRPDRHSRLLIFVRGLLLIPNLVVLGFVSLAAVIVMFLGWWGVLFTGRFPQGMWEFGVKWQRWSANVAAYLLMLRDEYPPFGSSGYPIQFEIQQMPQQSRLLLFVRWLALLPHYVCLWFLAIGLYVVSFIAWWAILITGHYPEGMFGFTAGVLRWSMRVSLYRYTLTDRYPPFTLE